MVTAVGRTAAAAGVVAGRPAASASGFSVGGGGAAPASVAASAALAGMDGLLLMQAVEDGPTRDRQARRHGRALLAGLAELQLGLLDEGAPPETLERIAALVAHCPQAADAGLRGALDAIALRAQLELARRGL